MKLIRNITSVLLAAVFLLSGFGFTIGKMVCIKSGKTVISLSALEDCCAKSKKKNCCNENKKENTTSNFSFEKSGCCDVSNTSISLKDFQSSKINKAEAVELLILSSKESFSSRAVTHSRIKKLSFADLPPPLYGKSLLTHLSILII
jgi:hypothetical protein